MVNQKPAASLDLNAISPESLASISTEALKAQVLSLVAHRDEDSIAKKVKYLNEKLLPLFQALEQRNPTPDINQQIPLVQGVWLCLWSTIPYQDILPGRVHEQSYQIFANNGLYANLARYRPGHKNPLLSWASRWLLSYDLMILQTYAVSHEMGDVPSDGQTDSQTDGQTDGQTDSQSTAQQWDIENVGIKQVLRFGPAPLNVPAAAAWFQKAVEEYNASPSTQPFVSAQTKGVSRSMEKQYKRVSKARPTLEHLYIDHDFRLVKSLREKNQRPSYTVATRLSEA
ncbi:MAG: hypothetical protein WBA76_07175 [Phormidesmis sp.]